MEWRARSCSAPGEPSSAGVERLDCGHYGISKEDCLSPSNPKGPGCCWEPNATSVGGPQCYQPVESVVAVGATFVAAAGACWTVTDVFGGSLGRACADAASGQVEVVVPLLPNASATSPVYLLPPS